MEKVRIGISIGDINGVGLEVVLKALSDERILKHCTPVIYGSSKVVSYHKNIVKLDDFSFQGIRSAERLTPNAVNVINCWNDNVSINLGTLNEAGGKYAKISLEKATNDLIYGYIDGLVTAPINKKAMQLAGFEYPGHTEFLTQRFEAPDSLMFLVNDDLRVGVVTNHVPVKEVAQKINKKLVKRKIELMDKALRVDFGLDRPKIAVLGLNPHAGDEGLLGDEEEKQIRPAILEMKKKGILVFGPFPADGFFGANKHQRFDGILAMYHDQGLVPFKLLSFGSGVNFTAGLSHVRTSPDHGTAYDIAGKGLASPDSFRKALFLAIDVVRKRKDYEDMHSNTLVRSKAASIENIENEKAFEVKEDEPPKV